MKFKTTRTKILVLFVNWTPTVHASAILVALWEFDGDFSSSNPAYDGVPNGTVTFVPGQIGQAAHFDGATGPSSSSTIDYVDSLAEPTNAEFNGGLSIMAWVKPEGAFAPILTHSSTLGAARRGFVFRWRHEGESPENDAIRLSMIDTSFVGGLTGTSDPGTVPADVWSHVAVSWNGDATGGAILYVNGQAVPTSIEIEPAGFMGLNSTGPLSIRIGGSHADSSNNISSFDGSIDHISLWKGALTDQEVLDDFLATGGPLMLIENLIETVENLDPSSFRTPTLQNAFLNKLAAVLALIQSGELCDICEAFDKLSNDILPKTDGEAPPPDWVIDQGAQQNLEDQISTLIELLQDEVDEMGGCAGC